MMRVCITILVVACSPFSLIAVGADEKNPTTKPAKPSATAVNFFETKIRPVLVKQCYDCHGPESDNESGLRLDSLAAILQGGRSGPAIIPGKPRKSLLILAVNHDPSLTAMPPKTKLSRREIADLTSWVRRGAPWPNAKLPSQLPKNRTKTIEFTQAERSFWAFQPPQQPALPDVRMKSWPKRPLDYFVLAVLESKGLRPAVAADKRTLIRRVTLDLHGLPPTPEETAAFLADSSTAVFEKVVDRLLASPRYGERWARHWLDVVRYADSNGMDDNMVYVDAWRYRDYVISAFKKDKPFDQFVREHLAGDLLPAAADWDTPYEGLIATGFLMIGPKMLAEDDPVKQQMDIIDDLIDTIGRTLMGMTLGCVRCHDHKFDPIRMSDYYALAGIFKSTKVMMTYRVDSKWNSRALGNPKVEKRLEKLEEELDALDSAVVLGNFINKAAEKKRLQERLAVVKQEYAKIPKAMAAEEDRVVTLPVFLRGNPLTPGAKAPRGFPRIMAGHRSSTIGNKGSGRRELAEWLTRPDHPLTGRVIVNRIWKGHFGQGIVRSMDNFGRLGQRPDNQRLLDWLTLRFIKNGWSIKALHREILLSSAYQMSTAYNEQATRVDPENRLLWRMNRRRMEAGVIRDSLLFVGDDLDFGQGGPVISEKPFVILNAGMLRDPALYQTNRRSIYLPVLRSGLYEVFQAFDFPDPAVVTGNRSITTVAPQALFMMNGRLMSRSADKMAGRLLEEAKKDKRDRIALAYEITYGRPPTEEEVADWMSFVNKYQAAVEQEKVKSQNPELRVWQAVCRVLLSSNEFIYVD
jgi:hypothetical protein